MQLVLPFASLPPAAAAGSADAPFVICTGAGLVWINADGTPAGGDDDPGQHCPFCLAKHAAAVLPGGATLRLPALADVTLPATAPVVVADVTAPPLPARGPPGAS